MRRRLLLLANPHASTVSSQVKSQVRAALAARYAVEPVDTTGRDHATEIARAAAAEGYDLVVTLGGDGTVNEAANGLAWSATALACLPGGRTNVFSRAIGGSADLTQATAVLVRAADRFQPRRVDLGVMNGRHFAFASGVGLGASTNARLDRHPRMKARFGERYFALEGVSTLVREYLRRPPRLRLTVEGRSVDGVTLVVQNTDPLTYVGRRPVRVCEGAGVTTGTLSIALLRRASPLELLTVTPRALSGDPALVLAHPQVRGFAGVREATVEALGDESLAIEVDGDYVGHARSVAYGVAPGALTVVP